MNIRGFFTKKKIIWTIIILLVVVPIGYRMFKGENPADSIQTDTVKKQDIKQTVLATGQVVSTTDLQLSFKGNGIVQRVNVKEGSKVKAGDILAVLDQRDQMASLTSARGTLAQAQANYQKVLSGASSEDVAVAQRAVDAAKVALENAKKSLENTKSQQEVLVKNSYNSLLNSSPTAVPKASNPTGNTITVTISGTYMGTEQGVYTLSIYNTGLGQKFKVTGLENAEGDVSTVPVAMGSRGLSVQFSSTSVSSADQWTIAIPNTQASTYVTNYNAYQSAQQTQKAAVDAASAAVNSAEVSLAQAEASLNLKRAQARPADIQAAQAQILSAQGQVQAASAALENTTLRAPANGVITTVDIKVGEQATALKQVMVLQDIGSLHVEANISEANIASLRDGQTVDITFDALGSDRFFKALVQTVNPASTVVSGVVNYKVTASIENIPEVKPGMTANMTVLVAEKSGVLAMPSRAVISKEGKKFVRIINDTKKKTFDEREIQTGLEADGGLVEVVSGVSEGAEVVTFIKK